MLLYITLGTNDPVRAKSFYQPVLATLGLDMVSDQETESGYAPAGEEPIIWVTRPYDQNPATIGNGSMVALHAPTRAAVQAFHAAALAAGGADEGAPGLRYAPNFYSCYVRDLDGNKLSAVCLAAE